MHLTNRRITCLVRKAIQEEQFEPFEVTMGLDGDVPDSLDLDSEFTEVEAFVENKVFEAIYRQMEDRKS